MNIDTLPIGLLADVGEALELMRRTRSAILGLRKLDGGGQLEYDYRMGPRYPNIAQAKLLLRRFERVAAFQGLDIDAIYAELGGLPEVPDWSPEARARLQR